MQKEREMLLLGWWWGGGLGTFEHQDDQDISVIDEKHFRIYLIFALN